MQCVELSCQRASAKVRADMGRGLTSLASLAATASFVGFFGTVLGILNSFESIGSSRSAALARIASRLSDAMAPGILGFCVAVVAFWFHQCLSNQLQAFELEMQGASVDLVNRLVVHLERLRTASPTVWSALTTVPRAPVKSGTGS
jgi:biopolymer transport protein ExbB/TolQ